MRKFWSVVLVCLLIFSAIPTAFAQEVSGKISQEEALKIAKDAFQISDTWRDVQVNYREEPYLNRKFWSFSWNISRFGQYEHVQVEVDADTGEVLNYWASQDQSKQGKPAKIYSEAECKEIADNLVKKLAAEKLKDTKLNDQDVDNGWYGPYTYRFAYERYVNGVPYLGNGLFVSVNAETGKIENYNYMWDDNIQFPDAGEVISPAEAEKVYREQVGLRLSYQKPYEGYPVKPFAQELPIDLYYTFANDYGYFSNTIVDAKTGQIVDATGKTVSVAEKVYLPDKEIAEPVLLDEPLSLEAAQDKAKTYIQLSSDYELSSSRYSEGWGPGTRKVWNFDFGKNAFSSEDNFQVTIDALSGELISYYQWEQPWEDAVDKPIQYNYQACQQVAEKFLQKVSPTKAAQVYLIENPDPQPNKIIVNGKEMNNPRFNFRFVRVVHGIMFNSNAITIEVDNTTGKVVNYRMEWDLQAKFANPAPAITENEALDLLFAENSCDLIYTRKANSIGNYTKPEVMLVYRIFGDNPRIINAATGELVDMVKRPNPVRLDDVRGHWAEREIQMLNTWGVVSGFESKFQPDKQITRAEFVKMLVTAGGLATADDAEQSFTDVAPDAWYFGVVEAAAKAGIVQGNGDSFYPNRVITRQEIVVMLMNAFNQGEQPEGLGELPDQFRDEAKIAPWAQQAMLQALEMGILQGQNGYLQPQRPATKAEAAVILSRVLEQALQGRYY